MDEQKINAGNPIGEAFVVIEQGTPEQMVAGEKPVVPKRILVVDDELAGLRRVHVQGAIPDFYDVVADVNDPCFEQLRQLGLKIEALAPIMEGEIHEVADYFGTDKAVQELILSDTFQERAPPDLRTLLGPFLARAELVAKLKDAFQTAFPSASFNLEFRTYPRPQVTDILQCDALYLDLFLENGDANPVDELTAYLRQLSQTAERRDIPPIVLMSTHPELEQNKLGFSQASRISAAGLMVLPKQKISQEYFGSAGLMLSFEQITRQRPAAHAMRLFMASWLNALENAKANASKTLWNLDASAMQQIHFASVSDDDPFDQHLHELLSREHLVHIESDVDVAASVAKLDEVFRTLLTADGKAIDNRLIAPISDVSTSRALISHFSWNGAPINSAFISDEIGAAAKISRALPFGCVLAGPNIETDSSCLIHITQQCDLNGISRDKNVGGTLLFAMASARELQLWDKPEASKSRIVCRSLRVREGQSEREYDLEVEVGQLLALPLREFIQRAREQEFRVIGRLRGDIASHVVADASNHISRPASQKMIRPAMLIAKVFLQEPSLSGKSVAIKEGSNGKIFSLMFDGDFYSFQDDACVWISLWLKREMEKLGHAVDADSVCTALRKGWRSEKKLAGVILAKVRDCPSIATAFKALLPGEAIAGQPQLTVVVERGA